MPHQYRVGLHDYVETHSFHCEERRAFAVQSLCRIYQLSRKRDRGYLTQTEIQTLMNAPMKNATHELVRDLFVFSVFTGLAYSDVKNLTTDRLQTFFDGNLWIITRRKKTNTESNIRLLDVPKRIIEKYKGLARDGHVFPVPSNGSCNKYSKI